MIKCSVEGCNCEGEYAIYELRMPFKKIWQTDLCDRHEKDIVCKNRELQRAYPDAKWIDWGIK
jgi:hypothetical protein